jgi:hypothetical protein
MIVAVLGLLVVGGTLFAATWTRTVSVHRPVLSRSGCCEAGSCCKEQ